MVTPMAEPAPHRLPSFGAAELRALAIRLATQLAAAHGAGKLHLGLSPERIVFPQAVITDFGSGGNPSYAAPEQVRHFGAIGPWTDVYSLGLVLLALASGTPPGTTIVGAIEARGKVPDLLALPAELHGVVARMLEPDPARRWRTMHDVVAALEGRPPADQGGGNGSSRRLIWAAAAAAGSAALLAVAIVAGTMIFSPTPPRVIAFRPATSAEEHARRAVEASLKGIGCSWIDIGYPTASGGGVRVEASGVAAISGSAIERRLQAAAGPQVTAGVDGVVAIGGAACGMLDALRAVREPSSEMGRALEVKQQQFHLQDNLQSCKAKGVRQAQIVVDAHLDAAGDFALLVIDAMGAVQPLYANRAAFDAARAKYPDNVGDLGNGAYRLTFCTGKTGPAGILLVKGRGPFEINGDPVRFSNLAWTRGWATQMAWYQVMAD
jgi:hypothetical protein